jgi:hypothetical protein
MSVVYYPQIRSGITTQRPYSTIASFLHSINEMECDVRYSYAWRLNPLSRFEVAHQSISTADLSTLESFFSSMGGRYGSFIFLDPAGNLIPQSEVFADGSTDPFKGTRAGHTSGFSQLVLPAGFAQGIILTTSVCALAASAGVTITIGLTSSSQTFTLPAGVWNRVWYTCSVPDNNPVTAMASTSSSILMFGAQCAPLPGPGAYAKTPEMLGYHANCRFDTDDFKPRYTAYDECAVSLPIVEFAQ